MKAKIYHNAHRSKSRQALAVPREASIEPEIIKYLGTPLTKDELRSLIEAAGLNVIDAVRTKETRLKELGLSRKSNSEELLDVMMSCPRLIERPSAVIDKGVRMACPTGAIEEILQPVLTGPFGSSIFTTKPKSNFFGNRCPIH